jgi:hypothetical protein
MEPRAPRQVRRAGLSSYRGSAVPAGRGLAGRDLSHGKTGKRELMAWLGISLGGVIHLD